MRGANHSSRHQRRSWREYHARVLRKKRESYEERVIQACRVLQRRADIYRRRREREQQGRYNVGYSFSERARRYGSVIFIALYEKARKVKAQRDSAREPHEKRDSLPHTATHTYSQTGVARFPRSVGWSVCSLGLVSPGLCATKKNRVQHTRNVLESISIYDLTWMAILPRGPKW